MAAKISPPSKLISAIRAGDISEVFAALDHGADLEEADVHGFIGLPLRTACFEGNVEIVQELLNRGANINAMAGDGPNAPMRLAQRRKHQPIIALLIEHGAPSNTDTKVMAEPSSLFPARNSTTHEPPPAAAEVATKVPEPEHTEPAKTLTSTDNLIEYTPTAIPTPAMEEHDLTACYGVDTNLLDFDLQRLQDEQDAGSQITQSSEAVKPNSKLWNSGTNK